MFASRLHLLASRHEERVRDGVFAFGRRPINLSKVGPESDPRFASFRTDLQKMLMLSQSGKGGEGIKQDGKFGLGFKTVFFVSDAPYVVSGKLKFKIVGGLLPEPITEDEEVEIREYLSEYDVSASGQKPTVYVLPLLPSKTDEMRSAVNAFRDRIEILSLFAKRIKHLDVRSVDGIVHSVPNEQPYNHSVLDLKSGKLLVSGSDIGQPMALSPSVPTYWVTAPTQTYVDLGVAINASFDLDTGRSYLNTKSSKNGSLVRDLANGLYFALVEHLDSLGSSDRYEWIASFFRALFSDRISNWRQDLAKAMRDIFWDEGYGALRRLANEREMMPSMLDGPYKCLCRLSDIEWMVSDDIMASGLVGSVSGGRLKPGRVVSRSLFWSLGQAFFPEVIRGIPSYDLAKFLDDLVAECSVLTPDWCVENGNAEHLYAIVKSHIDEDAVREKVRKIQFVSKSGSEIAPIKALIPNDAGERLRAAFAPDSSLIASDYDETAIRLIKLFRCDKRLSAAELAAFATIAESKEHRCAVLMYLASDEVSDEFKAELRKRSQDTWLMNWKSDLAAKDLSRRQRCRVMDALSDSEDEFEENLANEFFAGDVEIEGQDEEDVYRLPHYALPSLVDVAAWWPDHKREWIAKYNNEVYGRSDVLPLSFDRESLNSRQDWMEVLVLGAAHRMGFKLCQHKGFIAMLKRKGWWDVYCRQEVTPQQWMKTLDEYLQDEEFINGQYNYWFRLFIRIYQFSRHLDTYIQLFESANYADKLDKLDLSAIKRNSKLSGSGIDAPGLQYALGESTGLSFVYRELVRRGAIENKAIHRFCFVPYPKVSEFSACYRSSEQIYDKAVRDLDEDKATFDLSFDIAITSYLKSEGKF